jgi:hypothetical protein
MKCRLVICGAITALMLCPNTAPCQDAKIATLTQELDLLKRENELLKRENELLKQENASLKKGNSKTSRDVGAEVPLSVTVDNVEYVYQGIMRNGAEARVTLLATSKKGEHPGPNGMMTLIDDEGDKYQGMPSGGFGARPVLREGVPTKLVWRFGPNPLTKTGSAPSATTTRFTSLTIEATVGGGQGTIEFRDVPAVVSKTKKR